MSRLDVKVLREDAAEMMKGGPCQGQDVCRSIVPGSCMCASIGSALNYAADRIEALEKALKLFVEAEALEEITAVVAGWNGPASAYQRHNSHLGATIPTTCGGIYELNDALIEARAALSTTGGRDG